MNMPLPIGKVEPLRIVDQTNGQADQPQPMESPQLTGEFDIAWLAGRLVSGTGCVGRLIRRDRNRLIAAIEEDKSPTVIQRAVLELFACLGLTAKHWRAEPLESALPMVAIVPGKGYRYLCSRDADADGAWRFEGPDGWERTTKWPQGTVFLAAHAVEQIAPSATAKAMFKRVFNTDRIWIVQTALASLLASILLLASSLFTMQVYDRVIATGGIPTLIVLSVGVLIAILVEFGIKISRAVIINRRVHDIDLDFAHGVFSRMLGVRLDQFPASIGTLAAKVRGFETVRAFATSITVYLVGDAPFTIFFIFIIFLIGGPYMAAIPTVAFIIAVCVGLSFKRAIAKHSKTETVVGNRRQGLLVEAINGAEMLKSSGGSWRMMGRWNELSQQTIDENMQTKRLNEMASFFAASIQQFSYVALIITGATLAITTAELTMGSIIACSIISGRVLRPINMVPGLMVQWAHARVAMENLEKLFALQSDNYAIENPLAPATIKGRLTMDNVEFVYSGKAPVVNIKHLEIGAGEKVAILGTIGAGKSTLLKLLAGLVKPESGTVMLDGLDLQQILADRRNECIGYLPQQCRLFSGTMRDNLMLGLPATDDDTILATAQVTGLTKLISARPEGLDTPITEGGQGLSGGQKQLVAFTRLLIARPKMWLLDEPTASMDSGTEQACIAAMKTAVAPGQTFVIVTHKKDLLSIVNRIIVITPQGVVLDGPRDTVISQLNQKQAQNQNNAGKPARPPASAPMQPYIKKARPAAAPRQTGGANQ